MAHENAELVRRGYAAFNAGDMETLTELFDESASWHVPARGPLAGDYDGRDATFGYFGQLGGQTGGTFKADVASTAADDEGRVIGIHRVSAERNGKRLDVDVLPPLRAQGRPDSRRSGAPFDLYACDEFWS